MINAVYNIDCMEFLKDKPDNCYDMVITSPPYNLGSNHHTGTNKTQMYDDDLPEDVYQEQQISIINELLRVLKEDGLLFYNHKNRIKNGIIITPYEWILKTKSIIKQELTWVTGSQNFENIRFYPMTEKIFWLSSNPNVQINNRLKLKDYFNRGELGTDNDNFHKRSFPVQFSDTFIQLHPANKKLKVFDPYAGSGTVRLSCYNYKHDFEGCEKDGGIYKNQEKRFTEHVRLDKMQMKLF